MEDPNRKESGGSKILTSEQLQKLQDLQRRRQEIQKAQDERSRKKRSKKKAKKGGPEKTESTSGAQAQGAPESVPTKGFGQRLEVENHLFTPPKELSVFPAEENLGDSLQVKRNSEDTTAPGRSRDETVTQEAVALKEGGEKVGGSATSSRRKRKKLHWGLDSKERWERKSNM